jgi:hypothetical protein
MASAARPDRLRPWAAGRTGTRACPGIQAKRRDQVGGVAGGGMAGSASCSTARWIRSTPGSCGLRSCCSSSMAIRCPCVRAPMRTVVRGCGFGLGAGMLRTIDRKGARPVPPATNRRGRLSCAQEEGAVGRADVHLHRQPWRRPATSEKAPPGRSGRRTRAGPCRARSPSSTSAKPRCPAAGSGRTARVRMHDLFRDRQFEANYLGRDLLDGSDFSDIGAGSSREGFAGVVRELDGARAVDAAHAGQHHPFVTVVVRQDAGVVAIHAPRFRKRAVQCRCRTAHWSNRSAG